MRPSKEAIRHHMDVFNKWMDGQVVESSANDGKTWSVDLEPSWTEGRIYRLYGEDTKPLSQGTVDEEVLVIFDDNRKLPNYNFHTQNSNNNLKSGDEVRIESFLNGGVLLSKEECIFFIPHGFEMYIVVPETEKPENV